MLSLLYSTCVPPTNGG